MNGSGKKAVVAMSGGVDSSVTAALVKEQGYEVIGITLQLYDNGIVTDKKGACCAGKDIRDAKEVADKLGIAHYVLNYEERFKKSVIDDFADTYLKGETPIPCVRCNQKVKFRDLLDTARDLGADFIATGHYAQRVENNGKAELWKAADETRDQSYFLFATTKEQLDYIRFPLGGMRKTEIRELAKKYELPVFEKPDSQDICFVPTGGYAGVIEKFRPGALTGGDIIHVDGRVLGKHDGVINFTVGQRRGLGVAAADPLYVVEVDAANARVLVGPKEALATAGVIAADFNWLSDIEGGRGDSRGLATNGSAACAVPEGESPERKIKEYQVKFRSTQPAVAATLEKIDDKNVRVTFLESQFGVSPGQALVVYDGDRVIGGGWIKKLPSKLLSMPLVGEVHANL